MDSFWRKTFWVPLLTALIGASILWLTWVTASIYATEKQNALNERAILDACRNQEDIKNRLDWLEKKIEDNRASVENQLREMTKLLIEIRRDSK